MTAVGRFWRLPCVGGPHDGQLRAGVGRRFSVAVGPLTGEYRREGVRWVWYGPDPVTAAEAVRAAARAPERAST